MKIVDLVRGIFKYKSFILHGIRRDIEVKYKRSYLGFLWTILNPVSQILIYSIIFSHLMKSKVGGFDGEYGYAIFLCLGIIPWTFFSELLLRTTNVFIDNAHLIKKVNIPKFVFPIICLGSSLFNFLVFYFLFVIFVLFMGINPINLLLNIFVPLLFLAMMGMSAGLTLALLNVFIRDVANVVSIGLQFLFWLTPIVYNLNGLPENLRGWLYFNPLSICIIASQNALSLGQPVKLSNFYYPGLVSLLFFIVSYFLYFKLVEKLADEL
jgi:lipopolysaccharide transport system permease protein